jgi:hypothetical protein
MKTDLIYFAATLLAFVFCCITMASFGYLVDNNLVIIPFMAVWGLSALAWPVFAVRVCKELVSRINR